MERPETTIQMQEISIPVQETAAQVPKIVSQKKKVPKIGVQVQEVNSIVRLPMYMREANKGLFEPRVVSIGPYHHGHKSTLDMEAHKERLFRSFLQRLGNVNRHAMTAHCTNGALQCYSGNVGEYNEEKLILDGCFIVELLLQWINGNEAHVDYHMGLMSNSIYYDLLLVDNQIPFFVLSRIFGEYERRANEKPAKLVDLFAIFFNHEGQFSWANNVQKLGLSNTTHVRHLLDLQYNLVIGNDNMGIEPTLNSCPFNLCGNICHSTSSMPRGIPGANELHDYGLKFRVDKKKKHAKIFDVTFHCKTIRIPSFEINFGSKILLANFFAYDQITHQPGIKIAGQRGNNVGPVTSYVVLMNSLIKTKEDVMVLQRKGILDNLLSNEEEVATFFNKLGRCALVDVRHRYTSMFNDINRYWKSTSNLCKYLVIFRAKHFRNPWTCLSLVGALMVLVFSCTSMIIAILNYISHKH